MTVTYLLLGFKSLKLEGDIVPLKPIFSGADQQPFPHPAELSNPRQQPSSKRPAPALPAAPLLSEDCEELHRKGTS